MMWLGLYDVDGLVKLKIYLRVIFDLFTLLRNTVHINKPY